MNRSNIKNIGIKRCDIGFDDMKKLILPYTLAFLSMLLLVCTLIAYIHECNKDKYIPYIVTVDKKGAVFYSDFIDKNSSIPKEAIADFACTFIENLYTKSTDNNLNIALIKKVYACIDLKSSARKVVDTYYKTKRANILKSDVAIESVLSLSDTGYQIDFSVTTFSEAVSYKAILNIKNKKIKVQKLESLRLNPLGLFIDDISISKRIS